MAGSFDGSADELISEREEDVFESTEGGEVRGARYDDSLSLG